MKIYFLYLLTPFTICLLLSCQKNKNIPSKYDDKSYINNFDLLQENPSNDSTIRILSPKAIIDTINNNIEIFNSSIEIRNKNGNNINIISGISTLNNSTNLINVFNNVKISILEKQNYFIKTNSIKWDLNSSRIDLISSLDINFDSTRISSSSGTYDIKSGILKINNNIFSKSIYDTNGNEKYQLQIISDNAKWMNSKNLLEFDSNGKQVETIVNFLSIK